MPLLKVGNMDGAGLMREVNEMNAGICWVWAACETFKGRFPVGWKMDIQVEVWESSEEKCRSAMPKPSAGLGKGWEVCTEWGKRFGDKNLRIYSK